MPIKPSTRVNTFSRNQQLPKFSALCQTIEMRASQPLGVVSDRPVLLAGDGPFRRHARSHISWSSTRLSDFQKTEQHPRASP